MQADAGSLATHAVIDALAGDDLDRAIESGLLADIQCDACAPACQAGLRTARTQRLNALAARERHRAREARVQARARERAARRGGTATTARPEARPPLPPAAAAALARAKARAAERGQR
jgi:Na+-translocating ferredoxin:NAD+ oxidoreductase RnfC subunit